MIELVLAHTDLARVRFAHSPVRELVTSLLVLQDPQRRAMHGRWLAAVRPRLGELRLELLTALVPLSPYLPAFLLPAVSKPWPELAEELDAVAASPAALVRSKLDQAYQGRPLPAAWSPCMKPGRPPPPRWSRSCSGTGTPRSRRSGRGCAPPAAPT
jgi:hypothetical protein